VDKQTGKWAAKITIARTMHPTGLFDTEEEAENLCSQVRNRLHRRQGRSSSAVELLSRRFDKLHQVERSDLFRHKAHFQIANLFD
jgi:hypothetical protein